MKARYYCLRPTLLAFATWSRLTKSSFAFQSSSFATRNKKMSTTQASTTTTTDSSVPLLQELGLPSPLILGSASFTRKLILKELLGGKKNYSICVRAIDEKGLGNRETDDPADLVLKLGKAKMDHLVQEIQAGRCDDDLPQKSSTSHHGKDEWIVLTGDQVVTCNGKILEKPESVAEAKEFCAQYATFPPSTVGSCVITHLPSGIRVEGVDTATIHFQNNEEKTLSSGKLVDRLLQEDAPILSCAGALMVEHPLVQECIVRIDGTQDSVMGLSKDLVVRLLRELVTKVKETTTTK